ncbi:MAG: DUF1844 domain-containing protein [Planctomycetes bacterium]|nr:DUF1844 domain-containing protein [Planctomycetota bacterium]MBI3847512.1 DUF1844 domain-containing protein [Planctomycetota bacterium]
MVDKEEDKKVDSEWKRRAREEKSRAAAERAATEPKQGDVSHHEASGEGPEARAEFPQPNFLVFISTLASQALLALGEIEHPATGKVEIDLPQAKYTIDLLQLLQDKTKGNRTDDESRAIEAYLYDLRMKYVRRST